VKERRAVAYEVGGESEAAEVADRSLGRLGLELSTDGGDEGNVDEGEVVVPDAELELAHRLNERGRLDVAHGSTELRARIGCQPRVARLIEGAVLC
jgi:hypothetical protein